MTTLNSHRPESDRAAGSRLDAFDLVLAVSRAAARNIGGHISLGTVLEEIPFVGADDESERALGALNEFAAHGHLLRPAANGRFDVLAVSAYDVADRYAPVADAVDGLEAAGYREIGYADVSGRCEGPVVHRPVWIAEGLLHLAARGRLGVDTTHAGRFAIVAVPAAAVADQEVDGDDQEHADVPGAAAPVDVDVRRLHRAVDQADRHTGRADTKASILLGAVAVGATLLGSIDNPVGRALFGAVLLVPAVLLGLVLLPRTGGLTDAREDRSPRAVITRVARRDRPAGLADQVGYLEWIVARKYRLIRHALIALAAAIPAYVLATLV